MADKTAEVMAKAMGYESVDENKSDSNENTDDQQKVENTDEKNQQGSNTDADEQNQDDSQTDDQQTNTDNENQDSSGDQDDQSSNSSDQGDDKTVVPGADDQSAGDTDQAVEFDNLLAERSNGRFKSLADIDKALEEAPENAFANEQVAKLNEYVRNGGKLDDFVRTQTVDYNAMQPVDLVREHIMSTEGLTSQEADIIIESDFGVSESASDREKQLAQIKLKRASNSARNYLLDNQKKWSVPQSDQPDTKAVHEKWQKDLGETVSKVGNIDVELNNTDKFSYKVESDLQRKVADKFKRPEDFFKRYINADGSENIQLFVQDMIKLEKFDEIVRGAASNNKTAGKKEVIDTIKNPDYKGDKKPSQQDKPLSIKEQAMKEIMG